MKRLTLNLTRYVPYHLKTYTASRMESHGEPGKVQISENTYSLIKKEFKIKERGNIEVKGKGNMSVYFLLGIK